MLRGMIRAATMVVGLATAMTAMTAAAQKKITVPAGTRILIRTGDSIDSSKQKAGYRFKASLETNPGNLTISGGSAKRHPCYGVLATASSAGKMKGSSELGLELTDIVINGNTYPLMTTEYEIQGKGEGSNTAKKVVGGAGLGALIGGLAGGGKRELGLECSQELAPEQPSPLPRKASSFRFPANRCSSSGLHQPVELPIGR